MEGLDLDLAECFFACFAPRRRSLRARNIGMDGFFWVFG